jgi:hypothetical protein
MVKSLLLGRVLKSLRTGDFSQSPCLLGFLEIGLCDLLDQHVGMQHLGFQCFEDANNNYQVVSQDVFDLCVEVFLVKVTPVVLY